MQWAADTRVKWGGIICLLLAACLLLIEAGGYLPRTSVDLIPSSILPNDNNTYSYLLPAERSPLPGLKLESDSSSNPYRSRLKIAENNQAFGTPHSLHADIAALGSGRFSHWGSTLYFSTSDNSDPRTNGRRYSVSSVYAAPAWIAPLLVLLGMMLLAPALNASSSKGRADRLDVACVVGLLALAGVEMFLLLKASAMPVIVPSSDGGNISSWAAGMIYPDRFATDFLLANPSNYAFYISIFLRLVQLSGQAFGEIGLGYIALFFPVTALQLIGYYALGRMITGSRLAGLALALMVNSPINVWGFNEIFGSYYVPLPRIAFDAILPFLMMAFLRFGRHAVALPVLAGLCGLSFYVHPVSAPAVAAGLLLAGYAVKPGNETMLKRTAFLFLGGLVFLGAAWPFVMPFLTGFSGALEQAGQKPDPDLQLAIQAFQQRTGAIFQDAGLAFVSLLDNLRRAAPVWIIGALGLRVVAEAGSKNRYGLSFSVAVSNGCFAGVTGRFDRGPDRYTLAWPAAGPDRPDQRVAVLPSAIADRLYPCIDADRRGVASNPGPADIAVSSVPRGSADRAGGWLVDGVPELDGLEARAAACSRMGAAGWARCVPCDGLSQDEAG